MIGIRFDMPFLEQLAFFRSKGYELSPNSWRDVWKQAHARAFTVARVTAMDVLHDIRTELDRAMEQGLTLKAFKAGLRDTLTRKGWFAPEGETAKILLPDGTVRKRLTGWRLDNIFATNLQEAYSFGRYRQMMEVKKSRPYWKYNAVMDASTRPTHAAMNGKVWHADHPIWRRWYPPNGFRCRCYVRSLSAREMKRDHLKEEKSGVDIKPDEGFDYGPENAGLEAWKPDMAKYSAPEKTLLAAAAKGRIFWKMSTDQDVGSFVHARNELPEWQRAFVTQYSAEQYKNDRMSVFMLDDASSGYAVKPDGVPVSVFSLPGKHRGAEAVADALTKGANHLDCFDGKLPEFYKRFGFVEDNRVPWDDRYAPKGWDSQRFGKPDIVYMKRREKP